jgi:hypothetical protein
MKILHYISHFSLPSETFIYDLINNLEDSNLDNYVLNYHRELERERVVSKVNRKFDILNIFDVMYHITDNELFNQAIVNISKLISSNGFIFITDRCGLKNINPAEHVKFRNREIYEKILMENGFEIISILPIYCLLNRPIFGQFHHLGIKIDNLFAPIYYYFDGFLLLHNRSNLNLIVGRKIKP